MEDNSPTDLQTPSNLLNILMHPIFSSLTESPICILNPLGKIIYSNHALGEVIGYTLDQITGSDFRQYFTKHAKESVLQYYEKMKPGLLAEHVTIESKTHTGNSCYIEWKTATLYDKQREPEYYFCIGSDITEYRKMLLELKTQNNRFHDIIETSSDCIWEVNAQQKLVYCSPNFFKITGYKPDELIKQTAYNFMPAEEAKRISPISSHIMKQQLKLESFEHTILHKNGNKVILEAFAVPIFNKQSKLTGYRGISRDVTKRNQLVKKLAESESRFQLSQKASDSGTWEMNLQTDQLYWSDHVWTLFGLAINQFKLCYEYFLDSIHHNDRQTVINAIDDSIKNNRMFEFEYRIKWPDNSIHWLKATGNIVRTEQDEPYKVLGIVINIDKQKAAEKKIYTSEYRYHQLFIHASDAIIISDLNGVITDANNSCFHLLNFNRNTLIGNNLSLLGLSNSPPAKYKPTVGFSTRINSSNGHVIDVEINQSIVEVGETFMVQSILHDISSRKLQEAKQQRQHEAQRKVLVQEVHHRIKNNLQGLIGLLQNNQTSHTSSANDIINKTIKQIHSIAAIHGLQGEYGEKNILISRILQSIIQHPVQTNNDRFNLKINAKQALMISPSETVPFSLIMNELLINAIKHHNNKLSTNITRIEYYAEQQDEGYIRIHTTGGLLPENFNFLTGRACGTGLSLIKSLMPEKGMHIEFMQTTTGVITTIYLSQPTVTSETTTP